MTSPVGEGTIIRGQVAGQRCPVAKGAGRTRRVPHARRRRARASYLPACRDGWRQASVRYFHGIAQFRQYRVLLADDARKALQGVRFDPDCAQVLRLELAKSNTKVSRPKQSPPPVIPIAAPSLQTMPQFLAPLQPAEAIVLDQHPLLLDQHQLLSLSLPRFPTAQSLPLAGILPSDAAAYHQNAAIFQAALGLGAQNPALQGCSTLFVANLSPGVTEDELRSVFKAFAGFTRLRMHTKNGSSVAFIEYSSLASATSAMMALQGFQLGSSERGGLRIEYARNKMADVNG
ncbi:hypothetical protein ANCDUO_05905 [Ancylostoma duodenale]|uniref:RRM domain-containing protein n=1 Tax=Ancylostoma duodenale TaxID=51022 RepID=A0A0C2GR60_9BILA|nr:hypothetical protein ANCDUO_05905 [Ancylostoma duodenale]